MEIYQSEGYKNLGQASAATTPANSLRGSSKPIEESDMFFNQGSGGFSQINTLQFIPNTQSQTANFNIPNIKHQYPLQQPLQLIQQQQPFQQKQQLQHIQHRQQINQHQPNNNNNINPQQQTLTPPPSSFSSQSDQQQFSIQPTQTHFQGLLRKPHKQGDTNICKQNWICWTCQKSLCADCVDHNSLHTIGNLECIFDGVPDSIQAKLQEDYTRSIASLDIIEKSFSNCLKSVKDVIENSFLRLQLCKAQTAKDYLKIGQLVLSNYQIVNNPEDSLSQSQNIQNQIKLKSQQSIQEKSPITKETLEKSLKIPLDQLSGFLSQMMSIMTDTILKAIQSSDPFVVSTQSPFQQQQPNYFHQCNNLQPPPTSYNGNNHHHHHQIHRNLHPPVIQVNDLPTDYARIIAESNNNSNKPKLLQQPQYQQQQQFQPQQLSFNQQLLNPFNDHSMQKQSQHLSNNQFFLKGSQLPNNQDIPFEKASQPPFDSFNTHSNDSNNDRQISSGNNRHKNNQQLSQVQQSGESKNISNLVEKQFGFVDTGPYKKLDVDVVIPSNQQDTQFQQQLSAQKQLPSPPVSRILGYSNNSAEVFEKLILGVSNSNIPEVLSQQISQRLLPLFSQQVPVTEQRTIVLSDKVDSSQSTGYSQAQGVQVSQNEEKLDNGYKSKVKRHHTQTTRQNAYDEYKRDNMSIRDIAKKYGVVEGTVKQWISLVEAQQKSQDHKDNWNNKLLGNKNEFLTSQLQGLDDNAGKANIGNGQDKYGFNRVSKLNSYDNSESNRKQVSCTKIEHQSVSSCQNSRQSSMQNILMEEEQEKDTNIKVNDEEENYNAVNNNDQEKVARQISEDKDTNVLSSTSHQEASKITDTILGYSQTKIEEQSRGFKSVQEESNQLNNFQANNLTEQQVNEQSQDPQNLQEQQQMQQQPQQQVISLEVEIDQPKMKLICFPLLNNSYFPNIPLKSSILGQSQGSQIFIKYQGESENNYQNIATYTFENNFIIEELKFARLKNDEVVIIAKLNNLSIWLWEWQKEDHPAVQIENGVLNYDVLELNGVVLVAAQKGPFQIKIIDVSDKINPKRFCKLEDQQIIDGSDGEIHNNSQNDHANSTNLDQSNITESSPVDSLKYLSETQKPMKVLWVDNIKPKELLVNSQISQIQNFVFWGCKYTNRLFLACSSGNYFWAYSTEENGVKFQIIFETFSDDQQAISQLRLHKNSRKTQGIIGTSETGLLYFFDVLKKTQLFFKTKHRESKKMIDIQVFHPIEKEDESMLNAQDDPKVILCYDNYIRIRSYKKLVFPQPMRCACLEVKGNEITVYYIVTNSTNICKHSLIANAV